MKENTDDSRYYFAYICLCQLLALVMPEKDSRMATLKQTLAHGFLSKAIERASTEMVVRNFFSMIGVGIDTNLC